MIGTIELTPEEAELLIPVRNEMHADLEHDHIRTRAAGKAAALLFHSLYERKVIPPERLKYFFEDEYNNSNSRASRYELFLRNAGSAEKVFSHVHFFKYLLYFIEGPNLPEADKAAFAKAASEFFRENLALAGLSRKLARKLPGSNIDRAEQFFQLALDCGCGLIEAQSVRRSVMQVR